MKTFVTTLQTEGIRDKSQQREKIEEILDGLPEWHRRLSLGELNKNTNVVV